MLDEILSATRRRLPEMIARTDEIRQAAAGAPPPPPFASALAAPGLSVIAEVKRRSPSRGNLAPALDPVTHALACAEGGAAAISVLTEPDFFSGSGEDLQVVARAVNVPVLRKDFIVDPVQIWEAAGWGAAAILLIVAVLDDNTLARLIRVAEGAGLDALVEVHTDQEARRALAAGAGIVGVNNRDLSDFSVDLVTAERISTLLEGEVVSVAESGILAGGDARRMAEAGYDAVLVGEALVRASDPAALVAELRRGFK